MPEENIDIGQAAVGEKAVVLAAWNPKPVSCSLLHQAVQVARAKAFQHQTAMELVVVTVAWILPGPLVHTMGSSTPCIVKHGAEDVSCAIHTE